MRVYDLKGSADENSFYFVTESRREGIRICYLQIFRETMRLDYLDYLIDLFFTGNQLLINMVNFFFSSQSASRPRTSL